MEDGCLQIGNSFLEAVDDLLIFLLSGVDDIFIVVLFLLDLLFELGLELEYDFVSFLFAFEIPGGVLVDFLTVVLFLVLFGSAEVLE